MKNITDSTDFDKLCNDKQISIYERDELKDKWNKMSESEKKISHLLVPNQQVQKNYLIEKFKKKYLEI